MFNVCRKWPFQLEKTVKNCQFSPKMSIKTCYAENSLFTKNLKSTQNTWWRLVKVQWKFLTKWHSILWPPVFRKLAIQEKIQKVHISLTENWLFEIGFYTLDTFNIPTDSENEWEEAKSNKGMTILYRSYDTQISYSMTHTKRPVSF